MSYSSKYIIGNIACRRLVSTPSINLFSPIKFIFIKFSSLLGVPQGSVLCPLLFIICINNNIDSTVHTLHCKLLKFVDDTKGIHKINPSDDAAKL